MSDNDRDLPLDGNERSDDLEQYGVWVKAGPEDVQDEDEAFGLADFDDDSAPDLSAGEELEGDTGMSLSDDDNEVFDDLTPEEEALLDPLEDTIDGGDEDNLPSLDDLDADLEDVSLDDFDAADEVSLEDLEDELGEDSGEDADEMEPLDLDGDLDSLEPAVESGPASQPSPDQYDDLRESFLDSDDESFEDLELDLEEDGLAGDTFSETEFEEEPAQPAEPDGDLTHDLPEDLSDFEAEDEVAELDFEVEDLDDGRRPEPRETPQETAEVASDEFESEDFELGEIDLDDELELETDLASDPRDIDSLDLDAVTEDEIDAVLQDEGDEGEMSLADDELDAVDFDDLDSDELDEDLPELELEDEEEKPTDDETPPTHGFTLDGDEGLESDEPEIPALEARESDEQEELDIDETGFDDLAAVESEMTEPPSSDDLEDLDDSSWGHPADVHPDTDWETPAEEATPPPAAPDTAAASESVQILHTIETELSQIKQELGDLRRELAQLRAPSTPRVAEEVVPSEGEPDFGFLPDEDESEEDGEEGTTGFFEDDEDETIALTGDELDNILNTAEFTEEIGEPTEIDEVDFMPPAAKDVEEDSAARDFDAAFDEPPAPPIEEIILDDMDETDESRLSPDGDEIAALAEMDVDEELADIDELKDQSDDSVSTADVPPVEFPDEEESVSEEGIVLYPEGNLDEPPAFEPEPADSDLEGPEEFEPRAPEGVTQDERPLSDSQRDEIRSVLAYLDQLLEALPEEKVEEFAKSEHFEVYKRLFAELGLEQ